MGRRYLIHYLSIALWTLGLAGGCSTCSDQAPADLDADTGGVAEDVAEVDDGGGDVPPSDVTDAVDPDAAHDTSAGDTDAGQSDTGGPDSSVGDITDDGGGGGGDAGEDGASDGTDAAADTTADGEGDAADADDAGCDTNCPPDSPPSSGPVDGGNLTGSAPSIAIDSHGYPHISYTTENSSDWDARYVWWDGNGWTDEMVDYVHGPAISELALDSGDSPQIAFLERTRGQVFLVHAHKPNQNWRAQYLVDAILSGPVSLDVDSSDVVHVGYIELSTARHARRTSFGDASEQDSVSGVIRHRQTSLEMDSMDRSHYLYAMSGSSKETLHLRTWSNGGRTDRTVATDAHSFATSPTLALDANDRPHVVYAARDADAVRYAHYDGSSWRRRTVASGFTDRRVGLAIDAQGHPHISYPDHANGVLKYATWNGSSWSTQTVGSASGTDTHSDLALDAAGGVHIAYSDQSTATLRYWYSP